MFIAHLISIAIITVIVIKVIVAIKIRLAVKHIKKENGDLAVCFPKHCNNYYYNAYRNKQ